MMCKIHAAPAISIAYTTYALPKYLKSEHIFYLVQSCHKKMHIENQSNMHSHMTKDKHVFWDIPSKAGRRVHILVW